MQLTCIERIRTPSKLTGKPILYHTIDTAITRKIIHFNYHRPIISTTCTSTKLWIYHGNMKHSSLNPHPSSPLPILYGIPSTVHLCQLFWSQDVFWQDETTLFASNFSLSVLIDFVIIDRQNQRPMICWVVSVWWLHPLIVEGIWIIKVRSSPSWGEDSPSKMDGNGRVFVFFFCGFRLRWNQCWFNQHNPHRSEIFETCLKIPSIHNNDNNESNFHKAVFQQTDSEWPNLLFGGSKDANKRTHLKPSIYTLYIFMNLIGLKMDKTW